MKRVFVLGVAFVENSTLRSLERSKCTFDPFLVMPYLKISVVGRKISAEEGGAMAVPGVASSSSAVGAGPSVALALQADF